MIDSVKTKSDSLIYFLAALKALRKAKSLDQAQVAEIAEMNPQYLSAMNRGKRTPGLDTAEKVASALGYSLGDFLNYGQKIVKGEVISETFVAGNTKNGYTREAKIREEATKLHYESVSELAATIRMQMDKIKELESDIKHLREGSLAGEKRIVKAEADLNAANRVIAQLEKDLKIGAEMIELQNEQLRLYKRMEGQPGSHPPASTP